MNDNPRGVARFVECGCATGSGCFRDRGQNSRPRKRETSPRSDTAEADRGQGSRLATLGLDVSVKKLVFPATAAICLGVNIDNCAGTISIPNQKLRQICDMVNQWSDKKFCSKRQLQSLLGYLLYIHKCVKPSRTFLNRMLCLLRDNYDKKTITLTPDFKRDLRWFQRFFNPIQWYFIF